GIGPPRCCTDLEIRTRIESAIRLPQPGMRVEFKCHESVRAEDDARRRGGIVGRDLERELLHGAERAVGTRVCGIGRADTETMSEAESERRIEIAFIPEPASRTSGSGEACMQ